MSFLQRVRNLVMANLNDLIDRAEDPEKMINQYIEDARDKLTQYNVEVNRAVADQLQLEQKIRAAEEGIQSWQSQAERAVDADREDLARAALEKKQLLESDLAVYRREYEEQKKVADQLRDNYHLLEKKLEEALHKRDQLIAREHRAQAQKRANDVMRSLDFDTALSEMGRMEEKVGRMEAEAGASATMAAEKLKDPFSELDELQRKNAVEDELAKLKAKRSK